jgi:hypothetical protein
LEMWGKEAMGCCQQSLMGDFGGSWEDQNADRKVDSKDFAHEVLLQEFASWDLGLWGNLAGSNVYCASNDSADSCPKA